MSVAGLELQLHYIKSAVWKGLRFRKTYLPRGNSHIVFRRASVVIISILESLILTL